MDRFVVWCLVLLSLPRLTAADEPPRPKYGPAATRLYHAREFIRGHEAPDYWALTPYYAAQESDNSCSVAAVTMLVNALRAERALQAPDELATATRAVDMLDHKAWRDKIAKEGAGVSLGDAAEIVASVLKAYEVEATVKVVRFNDDQEESLVRLRKMLAANEDSSRDIILVNFLQSVATGDPEGAVGHFAPVAAFDAARDRVLLLDPDRRWYEPYWISTATLLEAITTKDDATGLSRGLLHVTRRD
jgi:hypothetical protein